MQKSKPNFLHMNTESIELLRNRAEAFRALHQREGIFVIPNPWDAGSAKVLESFGFEALATSSGGLAFSLGRPDGHGAVSREESLENVQSIIGAVSLPVSADLENGYGDDPETCVQTILLAAATGLSGGSIEDATGNPDHPIYPFEQAVERIKAAVVAKNSLSRPFMLTARAENFLYGRNDLKDTIRRLEAFADAGADVLFAPGLKSLDDMKAVVGAVAPRPVNVIMGFPNSNISVTMLQDIGVKRVSIGSGLLRAAYGAFFRAVDEIKNKGTFTFANEAKPYAEINELFKAK